MSSGCCHPKNFFCSARSFLTLPLCGGQKLRAADLSTLTRLLRALLVTQPDYLNCEQRQQFSKKSFAAVALSNTFILPVLPTPSTDSFYFFPTRPKLTRKEQGRHHSGSRRRRKCFLKKISLFFTGHSQDHNGLSIRDLELAPGAMGLGVTSALRRERCKGRLKGRRWGGRSTGNRRELFRVLNTCHPGY